MDVAKALRIQRPWRNWDAASLRRSIGIYVHIPFCLARCTYCDYLTYGSERPHGLDPQPYVDALLREIEGRAHWAKDYYLDKDRAVTTVFIGGGTPTFLKSCQLCGVTDSLRKHFNIADSAEITVEANPETLNSAYIRDLHDAGVNRLSIGVQATQDHYLKFMGRTHRYSQIQQALEASACGPIKRMSVDLIYSLPGLTAKELKSSIASLAAYNPEQFSCYELTIEPNTPLFTWALRHPREVATQEQAYRQQAVIARALSSYGYYRYEVCSYAKPGLESQHNLRYWLGGDYLGLGLGASSRIGTHLVVNPRDFAAYQKVVDAAGSPADELAAAGDKAGLHRAGHSPPADDFLQLRTRAGLACSKARMNPRWLTRKLITPYKDRIEVTGKGLELSEMIAKDI